MPSLLIRDVDPPLHARLKERAVANRRSLEEEARELLREGVARHAGPEHLVDVALRIFGAEHGVELELPPRGEAAEREPPDFSAPEYER